MGRGDKDGGGHPGRAYGLGPFGGVFARRLPCGFDRWERGSHRPAVGGVHTHRGPTHAERAQGPGNVGVVFPRWRHSRLGVVGPHGPAVGRGDTWAGGHLGGSRGCDSFGGIPVRRGHPRLRSRRRHGAGEGPGDGQCRGSLRPCVPVLDGAVVRRRPSGFGLSGRHGPAVGLGGTDSDRHPRGA